MRFLVWLLLPLFADSGSPPAPGLFREIPPAQSGITWVHENGRSPSRYLPETAGPGVAIFDYNNDGRMDILLVNSGRSSIYNPSSPLHHALYRNNGDGTFTDVTREAGITADLFGMGIAVADYDGDGWQDLFISGFEKSVLYHNNGNGTFTDVTAASGIGPIAWATSAVWFDYDNDGKLDLYVDQFADYSRHNICTVQQGYGNSATSDADEKQPARYCYPKFLTPLPSRLYHNNGGGRFTDVSQETGILAKAGKAWGAVAVDVNGDGYMDLFVASDTAANFLWINREGKKFEELGLESGVAYSMDGTTRSGMGVDAGDFDQDGRVDLIVANINSETTSLYRNAGDETFTDINQKTGLAGITRMYSGWGLGFIDYDNDGWPDLVLSNSHPNDLIDEARMGITYRERLQLVRNEEGKKLSDISSLAGPAFAKNYAARGLAIGDLNNDGYPDVVFAENGGPPHLLLNNAVSHNHWLGLRLVSKTTNPAAAGAVIRWSAGGRVFTRFRKAGGSYLSSSDPREILGAGKSAIDWVEVKWPAPSHRVDRLESPAMDAYVTLTEGAESK